MTREGLFEAHRLGELREFIQNKQREYNLGTVELFAPDYRSWLSRLTNTHRGHNQT
jgi:hypothetical protein